MTTRRNRRQTKPAERDHAPMLGLGDRLRKARLMMGLLVYQAAHEASISASRLVAIECDAEHPFIDEATRLAKLYGVTLEQLAGRGK